jgi:hypothetical protein
MGIASKLSSYNFFSKDIFPEGTRLLSMKHLGKNIQIAIIELVGIYTYVVI